MPTDREMQIASWTFRGWRTAQESGAIWKNIRGHNVAIMERYEKPGAWKWRIRKSASEAEIWSTRDSYSDDSAKREVLERLADMLGL
jgi:hypothetical protein